MEASNQQPEDRVAAAIKITAEFDSAMDVIKAEYDDQLKKTLKENDERFIARIRQGIIKLYEKVIR